MAVVFSGPLFEGNASDRVQQAIGKGLLQVALLGQRLVQTQLSPGHGVKSGYFRRSIGGFLQPGSFTQAVVRSNAPGDEQVSYTAVLEYGRRARDIYPVNKQALFWDGAKHPVRHVHQNAWEGYHMFEIAAGQLQDANVDDLIGAPIAAVLNG